jgi:hypothetical protein
MRLDTMNVQMNESPQPARGEILCTSCGRQWFGSVAYCPYCGRKPSFTTQQPDDRPQGDKALAGEQETVGMPAGELHWPIPESPRKSISRHMDAESIAPLQSVLISGEPLAVNRDRPNPSLLFGTVMAAICVLLVFWMVVTLFAPDTNERRSPQQSISTSGIASSTPGPSTSAAQVQAIPARTGTAIPAADPTLRRQESDATKATPQSNRSLCSAAHEGAGLCKSQE